MSRVLLVDDDSEYTRTLKELIEAEGHLVWVCYNGYEALKTIETQCFDVVITDIIMPDTDGLEVIYQTRLVQPDAKIIAITGGGVFKSMDLLIMAKELGASMVLSKPFSFSTLRVQLHSLNDVKV
jgi:CheY-like chemotaxis protein